MRRDDRTGEVQHVVDERDLVADEVGDRQQRQQHRPRRRGERVERRRQLDHVEPGEERTREERQPRVEAGGPGEPEGREHAL